MLSETAIRHWSGKIRGGHSALTLGVNGVGCLEILGKSREGDRRGQRTLRSQGLLADLSLRPLPQSHDIVLVFDPDQCADDDRENQKFLPLLIDDGDDRKQPEGGQRAPGRIAPNGDRPQPNQQQESADRRRQPQNRTQGGRDTFASFEGQEREKIWPMIGDSAASIMNDSV